MGVLNVTPDSFSDGGSYFGDRKKAIDHAKRMVAEGADIIDIGGESSRPGALPISEKEELRRILPLVEELAGSISVPISIDTTKSEVADACLRAGARMLNDITGLENSDMRTVAAAHDVPVVIMHMQGSPQTMQAHPHYDDIMSKLTSFFIERIAWAKNAGINQIILDPGIGFGKTLEHNLTILRGLKAFSRLGYPLLVGTSRKGFLGILSKTDVHERLEATIASVVFASIHGATIVRVHDIAPCRRALDIIDALKN